MMMNGAVGAGTDPGLVRGENQDSVVYSRTSDGVWTILVVCDGMGGHAGGHRASSICSEGIGREFAARVGQTEPSVALKESIQAVNREVYDLASEDPALRGMGTTCAVLAVAGNEAYLAHVGDSRIYRVRPGAVEQMTQDHSVVQRMVDGGLITPEQAAVHPDANLLHRCIGTDPDLEPDVRGPEAVLPGDRFVLCSDGLWGQVKAHEIAAMACAFSVQDAVNRLIALANERGGPDNISVQIYHRDDAHPPAGGYAPEKFIIKLQGEARADGVREEARIDRSKRFRRWVVIIGTTLAVLLSAVGAWWLLSQQAMNSVHTPAAHAATDKQSPRALPAAGSAGNGVSPEQAGSAAGSRRVDGAQGDATSSGPGKEGGKDQGSAGALAGGQELGGDEPIGGKGK